MIPGEPYPMFLAVQRLVRLVPLCLLVACSGGNRQAEDRVHPMGERVGVGPLLYTVLHAEWLDHIGEPPASRLPQHRFLAIRLTVTNGGAATQVVPTMVLEAPDGKRYNELADAEGLPQWLGSLRMLKPAETDRGAVVFDVPPGGYRLRLTGEAPGGEEVTALVDIPYSVPLAPPASVPGERSQ
jgi:hypothetical protein